MLKADLFETDWVAFKDIIFKKIFLNVFYKEWQNVAELAYKFMFWKKFQLNTHEYIDCNLAFIMETDYILVNIWRIDNNSLELNNFEFKTDLNLLVHKIYHIFNAVAVKDIVNMLHDIEVESILNNLD